MLRPKRKIIVVGGGLGGLLSSILLNRAEFEITLIEKRRYPFHRVCGEYISNEVRPLLESLNLDIESLNPSSISRLAISSPSGRLFSSGLDLGGFGLSRYNLDALLFERAKSEGVNFITGERANKIDFEHNQFKVLLSDNRELSADFVIAAHGKRSNLDKDRRFFYRRSPYMGVKYHIQTDFPHNLIQLDNFNGGYCGTVKIEGDKFCLCYLTKTENLKKAGSIEAMEREILFNNRALKARFSESDFLFDKPEVINEISFESKALIENHVFYCGDSAGMITPLCGNGMAMAIHSAKILAETIVELQTASRQQLEKTYEFRWKKQFAWRFRTGRLVQGLFGKPLISDLALTILQQSPFLSNFIIKKTHGAPF